MAIFKFCAILYTSFHLVDSKKKLVLSQNEKHFAKSSVNCSEEEKLHVAKSNHEMWNNSSKGGGEKRVTGNNSAWKSIETRTTDYTQHLNVRGNTCKYVHSTHRNVFIIYFRYCGIIGFWIWM